MGSCSAHEVCRRTLTSSLIKSSRPVRSGSRDSRSAGNRILARRDSGSPRPTSGPATLPRRLPRSVLDDLSGRDHQTDPRPRPKTVLWVGSAAEKVRSRQGWSSRPARRTRGRSAEGTDGSGGQPGTGPAWPRPGPGAATQGRPLRIGPSLSFGEPVGREGTHERRRRRSWKGRERKPRRASPSISVVQVDAARCKPALLPGP